MTLKELMQMKASEIAQLFKKHGVSPCTGEPFGADGTCCLIPILVSEVTYLPLEELKRMYMKSAYDFYSLGQRVLEEEAVINRIGCAFDLGLWGASERKVPTSQLNKWYDVGKYINEHRKDFSVPTGEA